MATAKATLISQRELTSALNKAVDLAAERHKVAVEAENLILNWELIGRRIKASAAADAFANDVAASLNKAGFPVVAGTARWGRLILCGFFEKARLPQTKAF